jgi:glucuronokinase
MPPSRQPVSATVPARVHLAGNPSDGYGGAVVSACVTDFAAQVTVEPADRLAVHGPAAQWPDVDALVRHAGRHGHDGGDRLVTAAIVLLHSHLPASGLRAPGRIAWSSTIPRSVGLGGSSALVLATMRAMLRWWRAEDTVSDEVLAGLALAAEVDELGISAGIADRAVQAAGGLVHTDARGAGPVIRRLAPAAPVEVTLLWNEAAAAPSGDYHGALRRRISSGDRATAETMQRLAALADLAATALEDGDVEGLADAMDTSLELRQALGPVPAPALEPVAELRRRGARVNFAGSGGALVVVGPVEIPSGWNAHPVRIG